MNLAEARAVLLDSLRSGDNSYTDAQLDRAIRNVCRDFIDRTGCVRETFEVTTTANQEYVDPTAIEPLFLPGRIVGVPWLSAPEEDRWRRLRATSWEELRFYYEDVTASREPDRYAFQARNRMYLYPIPELVYTINITWVKDWIDDDASFWPGQADDSVTLNVPTLYLDEVLWTGGRARFREGVPNYPEATVARQRYEMLVRRVKGSTFPGGQHFFHDNPSDGPEGRGL